MMRFVNYFILLTISICLSSCKKDPIVYKFNGNITEKSNNSGLAGVSVLIQQLEVSNTVTTSVYTDAGSTTTNSSGFYEMAFDREKVSEFRLKLKKSGYFNRDINISAGDVSSENENVFDYQMEAKTWVNFDIQNSGISDPSDEFVLILYSYRTGCDNCASSDYNYFYGVVDTNYQITTTAGGYFKFTHSQVGINSFTDSVYLTPFDTVNYSINY